jgi:hypothetical protein
MFLLKQTRYNPFNLLISTKNSIKQSIINEKKKLLKRNCLSQEILKKLKFNYLIYNNSKKYLNILIKNYKKLYTKLRIKYPNKFYINKIYYDFRNMPLRKEERSLQEIKKQQKEYICLNYSILKKNIKYLKD